jgi:hypothetical protein
MSYGVEEYDFINNMEPPDPDEGLYFSEEAKKEFSVIAEAFGRFASIPPEERDIIECTKCGCIAIKVNGLCPCEALDKTSV